MMLCSCCWSTWCTNAPVFAHDAGQVYGPQPIPSSPEIQETVPAAGNCRNLLVIGGGGGTYTNININVDINIYICKYEYKYKCKYKYIYIYVYTYMHMYMYMYM